IFIATKQLADQLYEQLAEKFPGLTGIIHSNKDQNYRFNTINKFKSGEYHFVIATDIVARGIDVAEVSHVINFDLPDVPENYIPRTGRTERIDRKGIAISFITEKEKLSRDAIESLMKVLIPIIPL